MVAKTMLNQTHSRPICYAYAQELISSVPSKWKTARDEAIVDFKNTIPKIKELVKNKIENLYPKEKLDVLKEFDLTRQESCFWFTDRDVKDEQGYTKKTDRSIYADFEHDSFNRGYNKCEIGQLQTDDLIAIYFEDMVKDGVDVMKYLFLSEWGKKDEHSHQQYDYNGKKINRWTKEFSDLEDSIKAYSKNFYEENDLAMEFTMPKSDYNCHQRAQLVTPEEYVILMTWKDKLEVIQLKWYKQKNEMKAMFKAYAELIRTSRTLEQLVEKDSAFENCRSKIVGTGTAVALSSVNSSLIDECIAKRKLADTVAVVISPKESVGV